MILGIKNCGKDITVDYVKTLLLQDVYFDKDKLNSENVLVVKAKRKDKDKDKDHKKKTIKCFNCGGAHFRNKCPSLKNQRSNDEKNKVLFSALVAGVKPSEWLFDSGATAHMSHAKKDLINLTRAKRDNATAANGGLMKITAVGDVVQDIAGNRKLQLENVHVVPEICANLISIYQLVLAGNEVVFNKKGCRVVDRNGLTVATGRIENCMFKLNTSEFACVAKVGYNSEIGLWHRRLGHVSFTNMFFCMQKCRTV